MAQHFERMNRTRQAVKMGMLLPGMEVTSYPYEGKVIFHMTDGATGDVLDHFEKDGVQPVGDTKSVQHA